jgi:cobalt-zinc-cadmium efflux system protein
MSIGNNHDEFVPEQRSDTRIGIAIAANLLLTAAQIAGGVVAGSLALVADALHNLNDAASLGIALVAGRIARRPADEFRTFGYRRAEVIGALINLTALILVGLYLAGEAMIRFFEREPVEGGVVVVLASVAFVVDAATVLLTYAMSKSSLNVRAAFLHNLSDALASITVIVAGTLIVLFDLYIADLIATLIVAGYVLYQGFRMIRRSIHILMESVPRDIELQDVARALSQIPYVQRIHHIHVWQLDEHHRALEAHVVVNAHEIGEMEQVKSQIKKVLAERFRIHHSTLEFEIQEVSQGDSEGIKITKNQAAES